MLASLINRFFLLVPRSVTVAFLLDVSGALGTGDREVLEPAGVNWSIFHCVHPDFMEGHMRQNRVITEPTLRTHLCGFAWDSALLGLWGSLTVSVRPRACVPP